ncbi:flagellar basal-body MS-ring/collar protein FliF [Geothermobacter hydrogeniphilus]|uniref:Flagellar M-ring protein n=1 Tax=Geothermobacter hydrogeniphilus TaxID=1969733 RepID=A0A1X0YEG2_9BACT|nr:flagellar basal-body MS-ring/collar protein FliF [Geothermobacter hydrogeniphilus]ORJ63526.1 flagellar M-ring protein FliF [Geothermobacter hydrogeniphilus]
MAETTTETTNTNLLQNWPTSRKLSLVGVALLCLIFFAVLIIQARIADYSLLFANLDGSDASAVVDWLKDHKIPYELKNDGQAIYVPADKVHESRLQLAGAGLPQGGGVGFEIFDKQSFGMTDFVQKVNYRRALQGELARTISSLAPVAGARVHLALPERRLFKSEQQQPSASIIVKLTNGRRLSQSQISGIVHLVAGSVEGLEPEQVTIVDASGKILSKPAADVGEDGTSPAMLTHQASIEQRLERRAQSLLDRALGAGNSLVQVTASIDFSKHERLEEIYDPQKTAVVSEHVTEEKGASETTGGVAGVQGTLDGAPPVTSTTPSSRTDEITNYEVSKIVNKLVEPVGKLKSLSVAVLVADRRVTGADGETSFEPRDAKELAAIEKMVRSALGINQDRGDVISVTSMPFETDILTEPIPESSPLDHINVFMPLIKYALLSIAFLIAYLVLVRPMVRSLRGGSGPVAQYKTVQEMEQEMIEGGENRLLAAKDPAERLRRQLMNSESSPTQVVKAWLQEN